MQVSVPERTHDLKVGFDFDGVLMKENSLFDFCFNFNVDLARKLKRTLKPLYTFNLGVFPPNLCVVTGRPDSDSEDILYFFDKYTYPILTIYARPYEEWLAGRNKYTDNKMSSALYKAEVIKEKSLDIFIESDKYQTDIIKKSVQDCKVVWVGSKDLADGLILGTYLQFYDASR